MKKLKRFLALALAMVMVLGMGVSVLADDPDDAGGGDGGAQTTTQTTTATTGSITITGVEKDDNNSVTYDAYRILDMTTDGEKASEGAANAGKYTHVAYTVNSAWESFFKDNSEQGGASYLSDANTNTDSKLNQIAFDGETKYINITDANVAEFAKKAFAWSQTKKITPTVSDNTDGKFEGLALGLYMVYPKGATEKIGTDTSIVSLTTTDPDAKIAQKAKFPTIDKTIVGADDAVSNKGTSVNVGDLVQFKIEGTVPDTTGFKSYTYKIEDTLSAGLDYVGSQDGSADVGLKIVVERAGDGEGKGELVLNTATSGTTTAYYEFSQDSSNSRKLTFDIKNLDKIQDYVGKKITITYWAKVNNAALTRDSENNAATLTYSNDPETESSTTKTPEDKVYIYDFDIVIDKQDATNANTKLAGAKFVLYKEVTETGNDNNSSKSIYYYAQDANTKAVLWIEEKDLVDSNNTAVTAQTLAKANNITILTTDANGSAAFEGIEAGTYKLKEIEAPSGYNLLTEDAQITITATYDSTNKNGKLTGATIKQGNENEIKMTVKGDSNSDTEYSGPADNESKAQVQGKVTIPNATGSLLPATGGMGTTIFYILGSVLVLGAGVVLVVRRRMSVN